MSKVEEVVERLKRIALFSDLTRDEEVLTKIAKACSTSRVKKGTQIIKEGDIGDSLYIIQKGKVQIIKRTLQNQPYTVVILKESENVFFGELALIDQDKRSATVIAESDCELIVLRRRDFLRFCESAPKAGFLITMQIAKKLSGSLRKMNQDVIILFEALVREVEAGGTA
jgi:CRP/FNR family cyclic AMP-dependent transcriptional regulator